MTEPLIRADGLHKAFGEVHAVDGVSLGVAPGEIYGLVGPDGAGKTTLIKLIAGIINPTEGELRAVGNGASWPTFGYKPERLVFPGNLVASQYLEMIASLCNINRAYVDNAVLDVDGDVRAVLGRGPGGTGVGGRHGPARSQPDRGSVQDVSSAAAGPPSGTGCPHRR